jgi:hypothetical protein
MHFHANVDWERGRRDTRGKKLEGIGAVYHLDVMPVAHEQVRKLSYKDRVAAEVFRWKEGGNEAKTHVSKYC